MSYKVMNYHYPDSLPVVSHKDQIIEALQNHQVIIVAGDTGSGKTTQLPKMCLEAFPEEELIFGCTQPRRIAATSVSARVAEELGPASHLVGYKIRFHDHTSSSTKIKFMTDGVLLAETRNDRRLSRYKVIIVDEAHERSLNIDFLLGYLKQLLPRRPDLKIIVTSATIDTAAFSKHFGNAPIISVAGRTYPVEVQYHPLEGVEQEHSDTELEHCVNIVSRLFERRPTGDVLIFLATERDIRECCRLLENKFPNTSVLPLYGRLPSHEQRKIFQSTGKLKIIVATNVAETSLTVPGIRYVIDSGYARISHYNSRAKTTSLPVTKISQASCDQRKGRCGRVGPGICMRLYTEEDYLDRSDYTVPEINRSNLAEVILQMISLGLGDPNSFPFIDPPSRSYVNEGYQLLRELGAINHHKKLTHNGRFMAQLPIDPCISRIMIEANELNCLKEIKIISALLAIQDPRVRPSEKENQADEAHKAFNHPHSDFLFYLNLWNGFQEQASNGKSWSKLKKFCSAHFLSFQRMREWFDLHEQLDRLLSKRSEFKDNSIDADYEQIHKALLSGFLRNLAQKKQGRIYSGTHNKELMIFPGSAQFDKKPQWILGASFIETSKLYALTVANISSEWIEPAAKHLCKYSWSEPSWQKKTGQVIAKETVSLFGLTLSSDKKVNFGKRHNKNIPQARDIFIQAALVEAEINGTYRFLISNIDNIKKLQETEDRLRIRDIVVDDLTLHQFYSERLPKQVYDQRTLNRYLKKNPDHSFLIMSDEDILLRDFDDKELVQYPTKKTIGNIELHLEYHFDPTSDRDGVTFRIPATIAPIIKPEEFDWLVPGLLHEKITYLIKALPKSIRKKLVPVNESVSRILDDLIVTDKPFLPSLERSILKLYRFQVNRSDWATNLPSHLQPRYLLIDEKGAECKSGRNLHLLLAKDSDKAPLQQSISSASATFSTQDKNLIKKWENTEHQHWNFEGLPEKIIKHTESGEIGAIFYSTIEPVKNKGCVRVIFLKDPLLAEKILKRGHIFLIALQFKPQLKSLKNLCSTSLSGPSTLLFSSLGLKKNELVDHLVEYILNYLMAPLPRSIIDKLTYDEKVRTIQESGLFASGQRYLNQIFAALRKRRKVENLIHSIFKKGTEKGHYLPPLKNNFLDELDAIIPPDFLLFLKPKDFHRVERALQGLVIRTERFYVNPAKDQQKLKKLQPHLQKLQEIESRLDGLSGEAEKEILLFREMVEDYKLALFAPEIKIKRSVSEKKLAVQWQNIHLSC